MDLIAVFGDTHANSTIALLSGPVALDDGGQYVPSPSQRWLYSCWLDFWSTVRARWKAIPKHKRGRKIALHLGDIVESYHHGTVQLCTHNEADEKKMAVDLLEPVRDWSDHFIVIRGTEAHAGQACSKEESIAQSLRADPNGGNFSWWKWAGEIEGVPIIAAHHPGSRDGKQYTAGGAANRVAAGLSIDFARERLPHLALFGHNHLIGDSSVNYPIRVLVCPAWSLKNSYVHKLGRAWSLSTIGGWIITCEGGHYNAEPVTYREERGTYWTPE